jgi:hypothetical protein
MTVSLEPSTSLHSTPTSAVFIERRLHRKKSYTSKANLSTWRALNSIAAETLVNNLKPHWVSLVFIPRTIVIMSLNTAETISLCSLR